MFKLLKCNGLMLFCVIYGSKANTLMFGLMIVGQMLHVFVSLFFGK